MEIRHHIDPHVSHLSKLSGPARAAYLAVIERRDVALHAAVVTFLRRWSPALLTNHKDSL